MVHIVEATVGRRYAGWFIRNTEHAQRVLDGLKAIPLPTQKSPQNAEPVPASAASQSSIKPSTGQKVTWGKVAA